MHVFYQAMPTLVDFLVAIKNQEKQHTQKAENQFSDWSEHEGKVLESRKWK
jgi:hypothetical protein